MALPVALADLVGNQAVGGGGVGDAQQGFCQAHQRNAFFRGQRKLVHQRVDAGRAGAFFAHARHQAVRQRGGVGGGNGALRQQPFDGRGFVAAVGGSDGGAQRRLLAFGLGLQGVEGNEGDGRRKRKYGYMNSIVEGNLLD